MDLFENTKQEKNEPLAARMRPRNLDEYIGQDHIVGKGRLLRRAIAADQLTSVIFYGPPGTGKTTLARVIANYTKSNFITLNAVLTGVQNIRDAITQAEQYRNLYGKKTILFVDEVHRWNKSQQDALLPWVENGTFILVGATTENPFFEVNKALVSRSRIFQLKPLGEDDLAKAAHMALTDRERGYGRWNVEFENGALEHLITTANGDARSLLNALELAVETTPEKWLPYANPPFPPEGSRIYISKETAEESIQQKVVLYDRDGDYHYDIISAFIKSIRGRDPDAALYWMARMITAGEDPHFIFRRMLISACEDTGLADPFALGIVESCATAFDRIGLPEGRYMLTQAVLYLSTAPKSNSSMAFFDALKAVQTEDKEIPNHLRDSSRDGEGFGHGAGYLYPHAYKDHWIAQQYLPDGMNGRVFYNPGSQGYENSIREEVLSRRELQIASLLEQSANQDDIINPMGDWWDAEHLKHGSVKTGENLTFSPGDNEREAWQQRTDSNRAQFLLEIRNAIINLASPSRHSRCLVMGADDGLLLWELWRHVPEGLAAGVCLSERGLSVLSQYSQTLGEIEKPLLCKIIKQSAAETASETFSDSLFDYIFYKDFIASSDGIPDFADEIAKAAYSPITAKDAVIIIAQKLPIKTQRIAELMKPFYPTNHLPEQASLIDELQDAENSFYNSDRMNWDANTVKKELEKHFDSFQDKSNPQKTTETIEFSEQTFIESRQISQRQIEAWFNADSSYGKTLQNKLGKEKTTTIKQMFLEISKNNRFNWQHVTVFFKISLHADV